MKKFPHVFPSFIGFALALLLALPLAASPNQGPTADEVITELQSLAGDKTYEAVIQYGRKHEALVNESGKPAEQVQFYQLVGNAYLMTGPPDSALQAFHRAITLAETNGLQEALPQLWNHRGKTHYYLRDMEGAFRDTRKALGLGRELEQWREVSNAYIALGNFHYRDRNLDSAIFYYRREVALSGQLGESTTTTLMNIGIVWDTRGQVDSALHYYLQALEQSQADSNLRQQLQVLHNIGTFYDDRGDYATALKYYQDALALFDQLEEEHNKLTLEYNIANVLLNQNKTDQAIRALRNLSAKARRFDSPEIEGYCHLSLARAYADRGNTEATRESLDSLAYLLERSPDKFLETEMWILESNYHRMRDQLDSAIEYAWKAQQLAEETDQASTLISAHILLAKNYALSNRRADAVKHAQTALDMARSQGFLENASIASGLLAQYHRETGNFETAYYFLEQAQAYRDSLSEEKAQAEMNRLMLHRLEQEYQALQNAQSVREAQLAANAAELDKQQWMFITALTAAGILAIFLISLYYNRKKLKRINTRLNKQNRQIELQNRELSTLNEDKDRLMYAVAHDLRNPLNGIKGLAEVLKPEASGTVKEGMEHIHRSAAHALETINELVSLETARDSTLETADVDIHQLTEDVILNHRQHAQQKNIAIRFKSQGPVMANTDGDKVQRIIDNLVSNAVKFSERETEVNVSLSDSNGQFQVEVSDQGPGLTEDDRKKLFGKFQKLSAKPTDGESSTGLGLSIVHDFILALGGNIEVESAPGQGASFIVTLPKKLPTSANEAM